MCKLISHDGPIPQTLNSYNKLLTICSFDISQTQKNNTPIFTHICCHGSSFHYNKFKNRGATELVTTWSNELWMKGRIHNLVGFVAYFMVIIFPFIYGSQSSYCNTDIKKQHKIFYNAASSQEKTFCVLRLFGLNKKLFTRQSAVFIYQRETRK